MPTESLQERCELGQQQLMRTDYLAAEQTLAGAEADAWADRDFDTLARLYMPLQEARRQKRQRCGEGIVALDLIAEGPTDQVDGQRIVDNYPHGQLLVAGFATIEPAITVRRLAQEHRLFVETFLAAVYLIDSARVVAIVPTEDVALPPPPPASIDELIRRLPAQSIIIPASELPSGSQRGTTETYAHVMSLWERLHLPFLSAADATTDPIRRIEGYRHAIRVDYACELAHQNASDTAHAIARAARR